MITTLINADEEEMYKAMAASDRELRFCYEHPALASAWAFIETMYYRFLYYTVCRRGASCDIVMEGHADGDSSYEDWQCRRCGRGGHHTYY